MPHEGGADEDGLGAARLQSLDVGPGVDAALGDEYFFGAATFGDALGQAGPAYKALKLTQNLFEKI